MCCDDSCSDNCRVVFCYVTPFKNAAKDSLPCPDNTNKFILFWIKLGHIFIIEINSSEEGVSSCSSVASDGIHDPDVPESFSWSEGATPVIALHRVVNCPAQKKFTPYYPGTIHSVFLSHDL